MYVLGGLINACVAWYFDLAHQHSFTFPSGNSLLCWTSHKVPSVAAMTPDLRGTVALGPEARAQLIGDPISFIYDCLLVRSPHATRSPAQQHGKLRHSHCWDGV